MSQRYDTTRRPYQAPLVPSSMSSGGEVHQDFGMSLPGSQPVSAPAPGAGQLPETLPLPVIPDAGRPVSSPRPNGAGPQPAGQPRDEAGQYSGVTEGGGQDAGHGFTWTPSHG
jgi:hypothetical protein